MQRPDPDAAFFEDWRTWADLGGERIEYPPARRGQPKWWCDLQLNVPELDHQPGFILRVPADRDVQDLILPLHPTRYRMQMCGGKPRDIYQQGNYQQMFYLPAAHWQPLRAVLPRIAALIAAKHQQELVAIHRSYRHG